MSTDYRALCAELLDAPENAIGVIYGEDGTKHISTADAVITKADAALAQPEPEGFTPDHVNLMCFAFEREPWATWLRRGGCLESAHCELSDLMLAVLARWGRPATTGEQQ
jgi:hypothetical protein